MLDWTFPRGSGAGSGRLRARAATQGLAGGISSQGPVGGGRSAGGLASGAGSGGAGIAAPTPSAPRTAEIVRGLRVEQQGAIGRARSLPWRKGKKNL